MHCCHLSSSPRCFQTGCMRLPRSINQFLSVRSVHLLTKGMAIIVLGIVLLGIVPAGASAADLQLVCTPAKLRFGTVVVGQSQTLLVALTNNGQTSVTLSGITAGDSALTTPYLLPAPAAGLAGRTECRPECQLHTGGCGLDVWEDHVLQ